MRKYFCSGRYTDSRVVEATSEEEALRAYESVARDHGGWAWCRPADDTSLPVEITADGCRTSNFDNGTTYGRSSPDLGY